MMTKRECLEKMVLVWEYLYKNTDKNKKQAYEELGLTGDLYDCPCCEYARLRYGCTTGMMCAVCPLKDLWPKGLCVATTSVYQAWEHGKDNDVRKDAAFEIYSFANKKLSSLKKA